MRNIEAEASGQKLKLPANFRHHAALSTMALSRSLDPTAELRMSSEAFYIEAVKHMEAVFEDNTYVGLQAILLCCYYSMLNPSRGSIWFLVGLASRVCVDHGFHHETPE